MAKIKTVNDAEFADFLVSLHETTETLRDLNQRIDKSGCDQLTNIPEAVRCLNRTVRAASEAISQLMLQLSQQERMEEMAKRLEASKG